LPHREGRQRFGPWTVPIAWFCNHVEQMRTVVNTAQQ
jgi:hypothetical protein